MSKVLYIGHYLESNTGWSRAAQDYILALDQVGVDVVCRPVKLGYKNPELPKRILELENKSLSNIDVCVHHVLPHHMVGSPYKDIGVIVTETSNFTFSGWTSYLNLMNENIVICNDQIEVAKNSGVKTPLHVIPHCYENGRYDKKFERIDGVPNEFVFYFIGDFTQRKNIPALLRAFHTEFNPSEPVSLLLKVSSGEFSRDELLKNIHDLCTKIKQDLRIYPDVRMYKPEVMIVDHLSEQEMLNLHYSCDCLVSPSYGEAWCYPVMDAIGMGKYPICTNQGGPKDILKYFDRKIGRLVEAQDTPCFGVKDTFSGLFTGNENWKSINIDQLKKEMRLAYNNLTKSKNGFFKREVKDYSKEEIERYTYENVGNKFREIIEGV